MKQQTVYAQLRRLEDEARSREVKLSAREQAVMLQLIEVGLREGIEVGGARVLAYEWQNLIRKVKP